jgi:hypothetical protein
VRDGVISDPLATVSHGPDSTAIVSLSPSQWSRRPTRLEPVTPRQGILSRLGGGGWRHPPLITGEAAIIIRARLGSGRNFEVMPDALALETNSKRTSTVWRQTRQQRSPPPQMSPPSDENLNGLVMTLPRSHVVGAEAPWGHTPIKKRNTKMQKIDKVGEKKPIKARICRLSVCLA